VSPEGEAVRGNADLVREFHRMAGSEDPGSPSVPPATILELRRALISEEHAEVAEAFERLEEGEKDDEALAHLAHELADLLYVTYGSLLACGVDPDGIFRELHRVNMHKVSGPRREDGKQMKPPGWQPADMRAEILRQKTTNALED
jgi:predicted HAD superfamily Cof-like phosphohydrolase